MSRMRVFSISVLLCCAVLAFPRALRSDRTIWWILLVIILVISGPLWSKIIKISQDGRNKSELEVVLEAASEENSLAGEEFIDQKEEVVSENKVVFESVEEIPTIDELIDLGFQAKQLENFRQAADYFSRALALNPKPDLAFYLIMDCYSILNQLGERELGLAELRTHMRTFYHLFNSELRHYFEVWMNKEDLNKYFDEQEA